MSPHRSPRRDAERRSRGLRAALGVAVECAFAGALLGLGAAVCALLAAV